MSKYKNDIWLTKTIMTLIHSLYNLFSNYKVNYNILGKKAKCYCNSGKEYGQCCYITNQLKNKKAIVLIKENNRTHKISTKIIIKRQAQNGSINFKKGDINPLNKKGEYHQINIGLDE